jgi:hypothetical protein
MICRNKILNINFARFARKKKRGWFTFSGFAGKSEPLPHLFCERSEQKHLTHIIKNIFALRLMYAVKYDCLMVFV